MESRVCYWFPIGIDDTLIQIHCDALFERRCRATFASKWRSETKPVIETFRQLWKQEDGQDVAEYAVMLAVILVIVIGTVRLIGTNANNVFSQVGSSLQQ